MSDQFEKLFSTEEPMQPQLTPVEVLDRVAEDERRLISTEYGGVMAQESVEEAVITAFYERTEHFLGYKPSFLMDMEAKDLDYLAKREGLSGRFRNFKELGIAAVNRQVALIAERESLDMALTVREGLRAALIKKHTKGVEGERG